MKKKRQRDNTTAAASENQHTSIECDGVAPIATDENTPVSPPETTVPQSRVEKPIIIFYPQNNKRDSVHDMNELGSQVINL